MRLKCHPLANYHYAGRLVSLPSRYLLVYRAKGRHPGLERGITLHSLLSAARMAASNTEAILAALSRASTAFFVTSWAVFYLTEGVQKLCNHVAV